MLRTSGQSAQVHLTLSAAGGVVTARTTTEPAAPPLAKATAPPIGSLIYGHPKLRKPSGYRGDYELGLLTKRGSAATGDGDISYILWLQRLWVRGEAEQNQTVETDERWPSSSMWSRTAVVGHCASLDGGAAGGGTPGHLVTRWDADAGAFFARADAEACAALHHQPCTDDTVVARPPARPHASPCRTLGRAAPRARAPRRRHLRACVCAQARAAS